LIKPYIKTITEKKLQEHKLKSRIKVLTGNFIDNIPEGFDTIVMKCISGEFNDVTLDAILRNSRRALQKGNKLFFVDLIMDKSHEQYD